MENLSHALTLNWLQWLLTLELVGLAALPLAAFLFRAFPDRGYGVAKPLGLLVVGFVNWWLGSVVSFANYPWLLWAVTLLVAAGGLCLYRFGLAELPRDWRALLRVIAIEEAVFLVAFLAWTTVRSFQPDIFSTEKPMDFMLLQVSGATHSFPPPDAWMSGKTVNYYYLGYAFFGMLGRMAGVDPRYGFNLSNITIFALGCTGAYSLTLALTKRAAWGLAGAFTLMLAGNLDGVAQVVAQLFGGGLNVSGLNMWCSTRIIDSVCGGDYHTITEFPIFSAIWNDLHPHVMAIPFVLLALAFGVQALKEPPAAIVQPAARYLWLGAAAVALGVLFGINSWDYPAYTAFVEAAIILAVLRTVPVSRRDLIEALAVVPASLAVYVPYYLTVHNSKEIGFHVNPTALGDVLTIAGGLFVPAVLFVAFQGAMALVAEDRRLRDLYEPGSPALRALHDLPRGSGWWCLFAVLILLIVWPARTDLLYLLVLGLALGTLFARRQADEPEIKAVLLLTALGSLVLLFGDFAYLRDNFDNSPYYRMNTIFKLFYQAWILLAVAVPFGIFAIGEALAHVRIRQVRRLWYTAAGLLALAMAVYPVEGVGSQDQERGATTPGLDGLAYVQTLAPDLYTSVTWIRAHTGQFDVVAEGYGSDYWVNDSFGADANAVSALTGRPTIIGWPGSHEGLWRGDYGSGSDQVAAAALIAGREQDVKTLFTTTDRNAAVAILTKYQVKYVFVGPFELATYYGGTANSPGLVKFKSFLTPVLQLPAVTIYRVPCLGACLTH